MLLQKEIEMVCHQCEDETTHIWNIPEDEAECLICYHLNPVDVEFHNQNPDTE